MVVPAVGDVVLVPFPFSDLTQSKIRPAVCVAAAGRNDWICCQVTSNAYGDSSALPLASSDFASGGLRTASFIRPGKIFTANGSLMIRVVGHLNDACRKRVTEAIVALLTKP